MDEKTEGAALVLPGTGEVVDFDEMLKAVDAMSIEQVSQACVALHCSGILMQLNSKLKNRVIAHMRKTDAKVMKVPGGEMALEGGANYEYNIEALEAIPEAKEAVTYDVPKVSKKVLNKAMKLGGEIKKGIEAAILTGEPTFRLKHERKPQAEVEKEESDG